MQTQNILTQTAQITEFASINASTPALLWKPYAQDALAKYLLPYLGASLAEALGQENLSAPLASLLPLVRRPLALFTMFLWADENGIQAGAQGYTEIETDLLRQADAQKTFIYKKSLAERGWAAMEGLCDFLEENRADYQDWLPPLPEGYFHTAREFQERGGVHIGGSRLTFEYLRPFIRFARLVDLPTALGSANVEDSPALSSLAAQFTASRAMQYFFEEQDTHTGKTPPFSYRPCVTGSTQGYRKNAEYLRAQILKITSPPDTSAHTEGAAFVM